MVTVYLIRPTVVVDKYGDPEPGLPQRIAVADAMVAPSSSADVAGQGRSGADSTFSVYVRRALDVRSTDLVEIDGKLHRIEGVAGNWSSSYTSMQGTVITVARTEG